MNSQALRDVSRSLYAVGGIGLALLAWWVGSFFLTLGRGETGEPHLDVFTPLILAPLLTVVVGFTVTVIARPPRWRVWRWVPVAALLSNGITFITLAVYVDAEWSATKLWPYLWWVALLVAAPGTWIARPYPSRN